MSSQSLVTIVETPEFIRRIDRLMDDDERAGARIIHFFHNAPLPLFLLTAFAKNERVDLSQADRNSFRTLTKLLVDTYGSRRS